MTSMPAVTGSGNMNILYISLEYVNIYYLQYFFGMKTIIAWCCHDVFVVQEITFIKMQI